MCEYPQAFRTGTRTARKQHECCECHEAIKPGDQYQYSSGIWNGDAQSYKQCLPCSEIMRGAELYDHNNYGDGVGFRDLRQWFFGFMCSGFKGEEFLTSMAAEVGATPDELDRLLKIRDSKQGEG